MATFTYTTGSGAAPTAGGGLTISETGHVTTITIGTSGVYHIGAEGAQGGGASGGLGASVGGDIYLAAGTELEIVVGGEGGSVSGGGGGDGGGGGSFVIETFDGATHTSADTILFVAGGGGGGWFHGSGGAGQAVSTGGRGGGSHGAAGPGAYGGGGGGGFTGGAGAAWGTPQHNGADGSLFHGGAAASAGAGAGGFGGGGGGGGHTSGWPMTNSTGGPITGGSGGGGGGGGYGGGPGGGLSTGGGGGGSFTASASLDDGAATTDITATADANYGNGVVTIDTVCFLSGTHILTPRGEVAVEALAVGDLAVTATGEARPIAWIGRRTMKQGPVVRVAPDAFGDGLPRRELRLSPGHAVCVSVVDELFVPVGELVNGATIVREDVAEATYWHVELESHDVLLAEGLPCESYLDVGNRTWFGKAYGRLAEIGPERTAGVAYARPFVDTGPVVRAVRARLAARAEAPRSPYATAALRTAFAISPSRARMAATTGPSATNGRA